MQSDSLRRAVPRFGKTAGPGRFAPVAPPAGLASTLATGLALGLPSILAALAASLPAAAAVPNDPQGTRGEVFVPVGANAWPFYAEDGRCWIGAFPDPAAGDSARFISSHREDFGSFEQNGQPSLLPCAPDTRFVMCDGSVYTTGTQRAGTVLAFTAGHSRRIVATAGHGSRSDHGWSFAWSGSCEPPQIPVDNGDTGETGDGSGGGGDNGSGSGAESGGSDASDGNGTGDCFLTTAVVAIRGAEADDGPTLTTLRRFRDSYMLSDPARRRLVADYYVLAPILVALIPRDHRDWLWIGARIDAAMQAIAREDQAAACAIYVAMVRLLAARWLPRQGVAGGRA